MHWLSLAFCISIQDIPEEFSSGQEFGFDIMVKTLATGHKFPTGSVEERDVWLHVGLTNKGGEEVLHIPVPPN